jgi:organic radical activating enzyme
MMKVNEIFYSLAGEGIRTGQATIFIRLAGCNLRCWFCVVGNTYINTPSGVRKIRDVNVGDTVFSYDGVKLSTSKVNCKISRTVPVNSIYKIQFQNSKKKIFATGEHPFFISTRSAKIQSPLIKGARGLSPRPKVETMAASSLTKECENRVFALRFSHSKSSNKWKRVKDIEANDEILSFSGGEKIVVKSVGKLSAIREKTALDRGFRKHSSDEVEVFNIECVPHHNYLINGILSHNCDTKYESFTEMTEEEIAAEVNKYPAEWVTLTGGEPTLQDCDKLIELLKPRRKISIETNGTRYVPWLKKLDLVTVSPKNLFHPKAQVDERIFSLPVVEAKFVITCLKDLESALKFDRGVGRKDSSFPLRNCIFFLQPMNNDPHITALCVEAIKVNPQWRLSLQMHKLINIP